MAKPPPTDLPCFTREPVGFAAPSARHVRKWDKIVAAFMDEDLATLRSIQRTGARGRIFAILVRQCFDALGIACKAEPIFQHVPPRAWYTDFAALHDIRLRTSEQYNPDFVFANGGWAEATLSENTAFKKLFRHGHQAPDLLVLWLDADRGRHKQICADIAFPNARVMPIESYYNRLCETPNGRDVVRKLRLLGELKGEIL